MAQKERKETETMQERSNKLGHSTRDLKINVLLFSLVHPQIHHSHFYYSPLKLLPAPLYNSFVTIKHSPVSSAVAAELAPIVVPEGRLLLS